MGNVRDEWQAGQGRQDDFTVHEIDDGMTKRRENRRTAISRCQARLIVNPHRSLSRFVFVIAISSCALRGKRFCENSNFGSGVRVFHFLCIAGRSCSMEKSKYGTSRNSSFNSLVLQLLKLPSPSARRSLSSLCGQCTYTDAWLDERDAGELTGINCYGLTRPVSCTDAIYQKTKSHSIHLRTHPSSILAAPFSNLSKLFSKPRREVKFTAIGGLPEAVYAGFKNLFLHKNLQLGGRTWSQIGTRRLLPPLLPPVRSTLLGIGRARFFLVWIVRTSRILYSCFVHALCIQARFHSLG
jgi:hypothetical protein